MTKKVLFLNYQVPIKKEVPDSHDFYLGKSSFKYLYTKLFYDRGIIVDFANCSELYTENNKFFLNGEELSKTYQSVFLGLIAKNSETVYQLIKYLSQNQVKTVHYGRLELFDTKYFEYSVLKDTFVEEHILPFVTFADVNKNTIDKIVQTVGMPFVFKVPNVNRCRGVKRIKSENGLIRHVETFDKKSKFFERKGERIYYKDPFIAQKLVPSYTEFRVIAYVDGRNPDPTLYAVSNERLLDYHGEVQQAYQMSDIEKEVASNVSYLIAYELKKLYDIQGY